MAKIKCTTCPTVYKKRKGNFSKSNRHKSGYMNSCKNCRNDAEKERIKNLSPEEMDEFRKNNVDANTKYRSTKKFKNTTENYKERRRMIRNFRNWQKRTAERLWNYESKFYWTEKQDYFLTDIKQNEL